MLCMTPSICSRTCISEALPMVEDLAAEESMSVADKLRRASSSSLEDCLWGLEPERMLIGVAAAVEEGATVGVVGESLSPEAEEPLGMERSEGSGEVHL